LKPIEGTFITCEAGKNMAAKLFVGNLSFTVLENELNDLFSQAGTVVSVNVMQDRITGKGRGFGFVEMGSDQEAQKAIEMFHGKDFQGRNLTVNVARPREERSGGGGGGGGGGGYRGGGGGGGGKDRRGGSSGGGYRGRH
jgi:RNA recognition motif-containing protein